MTGHAPCRLVATRDAPHLLGVPASTVTTWHARRASTGLYARGYDRRNAPMFCEAELLELRAGRKISHDEPHHYLHQRRRHAHAEVG